MSDHEVHLKKFQKELSSGTVSLALLAVLAKAGEPLYGYLIAKELERVGEGVLSGKQSALYPVLRNLEGPGCWKAMLNRRWRVRRVATTASMTRGVKCSVNGPPRGVPPVIPSILSWKG